MINTQRLAIYAQRDKILGKPDLSDDLAEMLETELDAQVDRIQDTEDGQPWQFMDWVGRLQPSLVRPDGRIYPSWPIKVVHQRALADLPEQDDAVRVRSAFLALAERALLSEQSFVLEEAERQCRLALEEMQATSTGGWSWWMPYWIVWMSIRPSAGQFKR